MSFDSPARGDVLIDQRTLAACGLATPIVFAIGVIVAGYTWEGYSHQAQFISELGGVEAPAPVVMNLTFFLFGALIVGFSVGLFREVGHRISSLAIGYFGISMAIQPVFPCDAGCEFVTTTGSMHNLFALSGFVAFAGGVLILSRRMTAGHDWERFATYTAVTGVVTLVLLVVWVIALELLGLEGYVGTVQRLFAAVILLWIAAVGTRLYRNSSGVPTR